VTSDATQVHKTGIFCPVGPVDVAVVLVSHNSADDLPAVLASLRSEARDTRLRVVVADNCSQDASVPVAAAHPDVVVVPTGGNLGYAGGVNVAMAHVGAAEAVLVLNPDVRVGPGAVSCLLGRLRSDPHAGAVVPRILDADGRTSCSLRREPTLLRAAGDAFIGSRWPGRPAALSEHVRDRAVYDAPATVDWATGAAVLIATEVTSQVGPWDERFFLYSEETDYLQRVRQTGRTVCYEPTALVTHRGGGSGVSDALVALTVVNKVRYMDKHRPRSAGFYRAVLLAGEHLRWRQATHGHARWALRRRRRWSALPGPVLDSLAGTSGGSVVIPAHNEEAVIGATLAPLAELAGSGAFEVVVVCNGCTDRTAETARSAPGVTVLEIPTASKTSALAAGDEVATRWPRVYLDADIVVPPQALLAVARRLGVGDVLAARPAATVDTSGSDRLVRAYYRARGRLPRLSTALWGAGVYALSEEGHRRLGRFPAVTADDLHVDRLFGPTEKVVVDTVPVRVQAPRDTQGLLTVLTRARRGAAELGVDTARSSLRELVGTVQGPVSAADAAVYAGLALVARRRGNATAHTGVAWERDETSRAQRVRVRPAARSVDHVVCTRFNLPTPGPESLVRAQHDWLVNRMALFERYTVPSVRGQTVRDFHWLVYLDSASPTWLRDRMRPLVEEGLVTPRYRECVTWQDVASDAREVTGATGDLLLTTNLDNDDALAPDFVARLQHLAVAHPGSALFLRTGLILHGDAVYLRHDPRNAFCSVSEPWHRPVTAWRDWHTLLGEHLPVVSTDGAPAWLQVVHGQNVSNRVRGTRVCPTAYRARFPGMLDTVPPVDAATLAVERALRSPVRSAKEAARGAGKQVVLGTLGKDGLTRVRQHLAGHP
jgi:GT2 family glycosyltransferase